MSHLTERISKDCLNCGTEVAGRFCQQCGQENVEVKESFFQLLIHFVEDLTHFDGKLWKTVKLLLFKPGSLTKLYIEGKKNHFGGLRFSAMLKNKKPLTFVRGCAPGGNRTRTRVAANRIFLLLWFSPPTSGL